MYISDEERKAIFSQNLRNLIERTGKTQKQIASDCGVSPQNLNNWVKGVSLPKMGIIQTLSAYFHVDYTDLLERKTVTKEGDYYLTAKTRETARFIFEHPEYQALFDEVEKVSPEDIDLVRLMLEKMNRR